MRTWLAIAMLFLSLLLQPIGAACACHGMSTDAATSAQPDAPSSDEGMCDACPRADSCDAGCHAQCRTPTAALAQWHRAERIVHALPVVAQPTSPVRFDQVPLDRPPIA